MTFEVAGSRLAVSLVLERHFHLRPISLDLAVLELHIQLGYLSDPQVALRFARAFDGRRGCLLP